MSSKTLEALEQRGENAGEDMKDGVVKIWDGIGKAVEKVAARFN